MSITKQAAKETVHTFMKHVLCSRFDEAKEMFLGDVESMNLPMDGENEKLIYSILDAEEQAEGIMVPTQLEMDTPTGRGKQTIPFVCVETDDGPKIDMDMTLKQAMGAVPDELLGAVKEGIEGVMDDMESALEDVRESEEELAPELYSPDYLSDEFRAGIAKIEERFDDEMESIGDLLENEDLVWHIAWGTMNDDEQCPQRLLTSAISPIRSALSTLEHHRSEDRDAPKDASIQKIRQSIKSIRIMSMNDWRLCECTLKDGQLSVMPSLMPKMDNPLASTKVFTSDEIEWMIRDTLDLDLSGAIRRSEVKVASFIEECTKKVGFTPQVTVDWDSFRAIEGGEDTLIALKRFRDEVLSSVLYALFHLKSTTPLAECLETLHFRNVQSVDQREITVDGMTVTISTPTVERSACYTTDELQDELVEAAKELPIPQAQEEAPVEEPEDVEDIEEEEEDTRIAPPQTQEADAPNPFLQMVSSMESDMMGSMRDQMSQMFGKQFALEVEWDSMDEDQDHFNLVVSGAMGAAMGALMVMAYDQTKKEPVIAALDGLTLRYDHAVRGVQVALNDRILTVACGGPASEYVQDPQAMGDMIMTLLA